MNTIDSCLIAGTHGNANAARLFWVRLAMALVLGYVVGEPLLLKVFEPEIQQQVRQDRAARMSDLRTCNPVPYKVLDPHTVADCRARGMAILAKRITGATAYDRMIASRIARNEERYDKRESVRFRQRLQPLEDETTRLDQQEEDRRIARDHAMDAKRRQHDADLQKKIDTYARRLRGEPAL